MKSEEVPGSLVAELRAAVAGGVVVDAALAPLSRWKVGGNADVIVEPSSIAQAIEVMEIMSRHRAAFFVMGDATNVLFDSRGFRGVVMRIGRRMGEFGVEGNFAWSQAGAWMPHFARHVGCRGLSGLEHTIGIPGTLGGLVAMNGGSQRRGIGENVTRVVCADRAGHVFKLSRAECGFAYRTSRFQRENLVVLNVEFELEPRDAGDVRRAMLQIMKQRRNKFPKHLPNCGSTFLSDPAMYTTVGPPGRAIEESGLKGVRRGGAEISPMHANFIVNTGRASSDDILWLIALMRRSVTTRTGFAMNCEVQFVAMDGTVGPAHIAAEMRWGSEPVEAIA